jgi:hypothetical protein
MIWASIIIIYSLFGGYVMLKFGEFMYFRTYEAEAYGGIAFVIAIIALIQFFTLANYSLTFGRALNFIWPGIIILAGIRGILMVVDFNANKPHIQYECDHGGYLYGAVASSYAGDIIPSFNVSYCGYGIPTMYTVTVVSVLVDLGFQVYMMLLNYSFVNRLMKYDMVIPDREGYYEP